MNEFSALVESFSTLKRTKEKLEEEVSKINESLRDLEKTLMAKMEEMNLEKFSVPGMGTIYQSERFYVKTPKTPEQKEVFFDYLKSTGEYDALISVNSQTLNAWAKAKLEHFKDNGEVFEIPGLTEMGFHKSLILRKT